MRRVITLIAVAAVVVLAVAAYQYDKKSDEKKLAEEQAQLEALADIEDPQLKIKRYEQLLETDPSPGTKARASRSMLLVMMRELDDAPRAIERGRAMLDGEPEAEVRAYIYYTLFAFYRSDDVPQAIRLCREVLESGSEIGWLYNSMAWTLSERDTLLDLAARLGTKAVENAEDDRDKASAYDTVGWVLYKQGEYADAAENLLRAKDLQSEPDSETLFHLALAYDQLERDEEALEMGIDLLAKSMNPEVRALVDKLYQQEQGSLTGLEELIKERRFAASWEAPDFTLADFSGENHSLSGFRGKVVAINFWSPT